MSIWRRTVLSMASSCSTRMSNYAAKPLKPTIKYQADDNAACIRVSGGDILESFEVAPNVVFDYAVGGLIVGIELLNAQAQYPPSSNVEHSGCKPDVRPEGEAKAMTDMTCVARPTRCISRS